MFAIRKATPIGNIVCHPAKNETQPSSYATKTKKTVRNGTQQKKLLQTNKTLSDIKVWERAKSHAQNSGKVFVQRKLRGTSLGTSYKYGEMSLKGCCHFDAEWRGGKIWRGVKFFWSCFIGIPNIFANSWWGIKISNKVPPQIIFTCQV